MQDVEGVTPTNLGGIKASLFMGLNLKPLKEDTKDSIVSEQND
jgi:hypothetical protein